MRVKRLVQLAVIVFLISAAIVTFKILNDDEKTAVEDYVDLDLTEYAENFSAAFALVLKDYKNVDLEDFTMFAEELYSSNSDSDKLVNAFDEAYYNNGFVKKSPTVILIDHSNESIILLFTTTESMLIKLTLLSDEEWENYTIEKIEYEPSS